MAEREKSYEASDYAWLVAMSFFFLGLVVIASWREIFPAWRPFQRSFHDALQKYAGVQKADAFVPGIKQIWIPKIQVVDRCVTCHLGYDWAGTLPTDLREPLTPHPRLTYLDKHPFQEFGCTPCHGGQGWATTADAAHDDKDWDDPLLSVSLAKQYDLSEAELIQMRCNYCHRHDAETPGMDAINLGKHLFKAKKCIVCHTVEGRGGNTAPEITYFGDKNPELMDFGHVNGPRTMFNWNYQHLMNPDLVSPHTTMPTFNFQPSEARALTLMMLSWRREIFPPEYIPTPRESMPTAEAFPSVAPSSSEAAPAETH